MDGAMGSPVAQIGMPLAAGYAGSRGGAGGVNAALNTSQYMMRQAADKRVREMFGEMGPYDDPSQSVTAAGAGTTPPEATRVGDYMDQLSNLGAAGGMAAMPTVVRGLTSLHNTTTKYEQPDFDIDQGNILNTRTGDVSGIAPAQQAALDETERYNTSRMDVNTARISELGSREELTGERVDTEVSKQELSSALIQKIEAEI